LQHANATYRNIVGRNMLRALVGSSLKKVKFEPTTPNTSATCRNSVAKRMQHVAPNNAAICSVGMLRSFGRTFKFQVAMLSSLSVGKRQLRMGPYLGCGMLTMANWFTSGQLEFAFGQFLCSMLIIFFSCLLGPTSTCAINIAEGK